jgi:hypothetical protein
MKKVYVISGGTRVYVAPHFALSAPAHGTVGLDISIRLFEALLETAGEDPFEVIPIFTRMAAGGEKNFMFPELTKNYERGRHTVFEAGLKYVDTNDDLSCLVDHLLEDPDTRGIVMAAAVCDWEPTMFKGTFKETVDSFGKDKSRLRTRGPDGQDVSLELRLKPADKIIQRIRKGDKGRKDVFLVSFKTTAGVSAQETYVAGLKSLKGSSSNLVFANDIQNGHNVVVTPEEFPYFGDGETPGQKRSDALVKLCQMIIGRTQLTFTRTAVRTGETADLTTLHREGKLPPNFVPVLHWLVENDAYKVLPWKDSTSGHFGAFVEGEPYSRVSSIRKANHNLVFEEGAARILGEQDGMILAEGGKPSVGEHTQDQIYTEINENLAKDTPDAQVHSIVHFHSPLKKLEKVVHKGQAALRSAVPIRGQMMYECGSDQCGINTATGMMHMKGLTDDGRYAGIWAVHLRGHGPNIAFNRNVDPKVVIEFIQKHWDVDRKTGGLLSPNVTTSKDWGTDGNIE